MQALSFPASRSWSTLLLESPDDHLSLLLDTRSNRQSLPKSFIPLGINNSELVSFLLHLLVGITFIFSGSTGPSLLWAGLVQLQRVGSTFVVMHRLLIVVASLVVEHRLQVPGLWQLLYAGSVVVAPRLQSIQSLLHMGFHCFEECGIFLDQGSNTCLLPWQADSYPLYHQGSPLNHF